MKKLIALISFTLLCNAGFSQTLKLDSLISIYQKDKLDTIKLGHLLEIIKEHEVTGEYVEAEARCNEALLNSNKISKNSQEKNTLNFLKNYNADIHN